jgi:hypothetical protein
MTRILAGAALALLCSAAQAQTISGADIQRQLSDKRVALSCVDGTKGTGRYTMGRNFGTISGAYRRAGGEAMKDTGRVRAQGNRLCLQFRMFNGGEESCFGVVQQAAGQFQFTAAGGLVRVCNVSVI